jgi:hypothetical protein
MQLLLRCDQCNLDVLDDPEPALIGRVVATVRRLETFMPGNTRTDPTTVGRWRSSAADRLEATTWLQDCLAELADAGLHLLAGEYTACLDDDEANAAAACLVLASLDGDDVAGDESGDAPDDDELDDPADDGDVSGI